MGRQNELTNKQWEGGNVVPAGFITYLDGTVNDGDLVLSGENIQLSRLELRRRNRISGVLTGRQQAPM